MDTLNCKTEIINRSLSLLREEEIVDSNIEPETDTEKLAYKWFETAKAECIVEINAPFCIKRQILTKEDLVNAITLEPLKKTEWEEENLTFEEWMKKKAMEWIKELEIRKEKLKEDIKHLLMEKRLLEETIILKNNEIRQKEEEYEEAETEEEKERILEEIKQLRKELERLKRDVRKDIRLIRYKRFKIILLINDIRYLKEMYGIDDKEDEEIEEDIELNNKEENNTNCPFPEHWRRRQWIRWRNIRRRWIERERWIQYQEWMLYQQKLNSENKKKTALYKYRIPSDCLKILDNNYNKLRIEGNYIYYNSDNLLLRYLTLNTELYNREIKFNMALSYTLAYYMCADLTNNDQKIQLFFDLKSNKISEARTFYLRQSGVKIIKNYQWKKK